MKLKDCNIQVGDMMRLTANLHVFIKRGLHVFIGRGGTWGYEWYVFIDQDGCVHEYHGTIECEVLSRVAEALG